MNWFIGIVITILSLLMVLIVFCWYMDSLPTKKQNEVCKKMDNWIDNFWK